MAEGGTALSVTPEGNGQFCDVCRQDNNVEDASCYCKQCRQLLCKQCENYHRKLAFSKAHELINAADSELDNADPQAEVSDEVRAPMCSTHGQPFEFYCREHDDPVCGSCKILNHRKCSDLQDLEIAAQNNTEIYQEVLDQMKAINSAMDVVKHDIEKEEDTLETHRNKAIEKIENKIKEIESAGQKQICEVETMFQEGKEQLDRDRKGVTDSQQLILKRIRELELTSMSCSPEEKFLAAKSACKETGKIYDILHESSHIKHTKIEFKIDSKLEEIESIGEIRLEKSTSNTDYHHQLVHVMDLGEANLIVLRMEILPSKQILFGTITRKSDNSRLHLYSSSQQLLSQFDITGIPSFAVNNLQIMVAKETTGLLLINIDTNKLSQVKHIETEVEPLLAATYSADSIITLNKGKHSLFWQILKSNGEIKAEVSLSIEQSINITEPVNMLINKKQNVIYIVECSKGCYGFNLKGECLFHFEQEGSNLYIGLVVDHNDNIYITCASEKEKEIDDDKQNTGNANHDDSDDDDHWEQKIRSQIVQLSPTGVFQKQVLAIPTMAVPILYSENKLYVSTTEQNQEKQITSVYQLYT